MPTSAKFTNDIDTYLIQLQDIGAHMQKILIPIQKLQEEWQKSMQPLLEAQVAIQKSFEPAVQTAMEEWRKYIPSFELPQNLTLDYGPMAEQVIALTKSFYEIVSPAFEALQRSFDKLPPKTRQALILLATNGWFFDLDMPFTSLWELKEALEEGKIEDAEKALVKYFDENLSKIEKSIIDRFPNRERIIRAAFSAHRRGEYELSIPVFFSQTDGICKDVVNEYFFMKQNHKPRIANYVKQIAADSLRSAILTPLTQNLPIVMSEKERGPDFTALNRHMVLHGESLDYGTKTNSLKVISLINYVTNVL